MSLRYEQEVIRTAQREKKTTHMALNKEQNESSQNRKKLNSFSLSNEIGDCVLKNRRMTKAEIKFQLDEHAKDEAENCHHGLDGMLGIFMKLQMDIKNRT